jgi:predicted phosphoribosyltransferase
MDKYLNRTAAGKSLANQLIEYANRDDVIVLALPRGGVPVAFEIAKALHVPLDVFIVRKLGVPQHRELAMGAIATGDISVFNDEIISEYNIPIHAIQAVMAEEKQELKRRENAYRGNQPFPVLKNKMVILVDDGIATGASMRAAIKALKVFMPAKIIIAVPVAEKMMCETMQSLADDLVCPMQPVFFNAVGAWYDDFSQTEDEEVYTLLKKAREFV